MCISYSGRCLLSNYLNGRDANRGECVQACRWKYGLHRLRAELTEAKHPEPLSVEEDERGTYLLNSRDLNLVRHLGELQEAGICSLKIEGRMKSEYYVGTVVNAYRRVMDGMMSCEEAECELEKTAHRAYTTAYFLGENPDTQCLTASKPDQTYDFAALVTEVFLRGGKRIAVLEQRNRFREGEELELLSAGEGHGARLTVCGMTDEAGEPVSDARLVQQKLFLPTDLPVLPGDMFRKRRADR